MAKFEYPKTLFHPTAAPRVVTSVDQHELLGPDWQETPFTPRYPHPLGELAPTVPDAVPVVPGTGAVATSAPDAQAAQQAAADAQRKAYYNLSAKDALARLEEVEAVAGRPGLVKLQEVETAKPGGPRASVLKALTARLVELDTPPTGE